MDAAVAAVTVGGLVAGSLGLAWGLVAYGRHTRSSEVGHLRDEVQHLRKSLEAERRHSRIRAAGAALDLQRAVALAAAGAAGDLDGVLRQFPDDVGAAPSEPGEPPLAGDVEDDSG